MMQEDRKARSTIDLSSLGQNTWTEIAHKGNLRFKEHEQAPGTYHAKPQTAKFGWEDKYEGLQADK